MVGDSSGRAINSTWHLRSSRASMAKQQMSSGKFAVQSVSGRVLMSRSFGMIILETATNIIVPDQ